MLSASVQHPWNKTATAMVRITLSKYRGPAASQQYTGILTCTMPGQIGITAVAAYSDMQVFLAVGLSAYTVRVCKVQQRQH